MTVPTETVIDVDWDRGQFTTPFGEIGDPPRVDAPMEPTFLVTPDVVAACLRPDGWEHQGIIGHVDRDGFLTVFNPAAGTFIYELHPGVWSDNEPLPIYLAVWPD